MTTAAEVDLVLADASSRIRDMRLRTLGAIDIAFRPGAVRSLQREETVLYDYLQPLEASTMGFWAATSFAPMPGYVPHVRWLPVAKAHAEAFKVLQGEYSQLRTESLWEQYRTNAEMVRQLDAKIRAEENSIMSATVDLAGRAAKAGLDFARGSIRSVENVLGTGIRSARDVAVETTKTLQVVAGEAGATVRTGIEVGGETVSDIAREGRKTVTSGLAVWGIVAAVVGLGIVLIVGGPVVKAYLPKGGSK